MAPSLHSYILATLLVALSFRATSAAHHLPDGLRSLHFTLYEHDVVNKSGYFIVKGVTGPEITPTTAPFGSLYVLRDPLTITSNSSSKVVGTVEGLGITTTFDGLRTITGLTYTIEMMNHKGSITVIGSVHNVKPTDIPVVGGNGDFRFVQGYVTASMEHNNGFSIVYKMEFHLHWPPYAN